MTAPRSFQLAVKAKAKPASEYEPRPYIFISATETEIVEIDGQEVERPKERTIVAQYPGDGSISLFLAAMGADAEEVDVLATLFSLLENMFNTSDYRFLRKLIRTEELEYENLMELIADAMEGWMAFPTQRASASTRSPQQTGTRSTGRVRGPGSTQLTSAPVDS